MRRGTSMKRNNASPVVSVCYYLGSAQGLILKKGDVCCGFRNGILDGMEAEI